MSPGVEKGRGGDVGAVGKRKPSLALAGIALGIGLFSAMQPLLFVLSIDSPTLTYFLDELHGAGVVAGVIGISVSVLALVLSFVQPRLFGGRWYALCGLLAGTLGATWLSLAEVAHSAQYRTWSEFHRTRVRQSLDEVARSLEAYAADHEGKFPGRLDALIGTSLDVDLQLVGVEADNAVTDFHYVVGLDRSCPKDWIVVYAHSELFRDKGGAILTVGGRVSLVEEPEFGAELERFRKEYESVRGRRPEIVAPR